MAGRDMHAGETATEAGLRILLECILVKWCKNADINSICKQGFIKNSWHYPTKGIFAQIT